MDQHGTKMDSPEKNENGEINDAELDQVTGGIFGSLSDAFSNAIKSIGEGLSNIARKG